MENDALQEAVRQAQEAATAAAASAEQARTFAEQAAQHATGNDAAVDAVAVVAHAASGGVIDPSVVPRFVRGLETALTTGKPASTEPLLLVSPELRRSVAGLAARHAPGLAVMSLRELDPKTRVTTTGIVKLAA